MVLPLRPLTGEGFPQVTSLADPGTDGCAPIECTLRKAIAAAPPERFITFAKALSGGSGTITLTTGELVIEKDLTRIGPGAALLAISGNHTSWVFRILP